MVRTFCTNKLSHTKLLLYSETTDLTDVMEEIELLQSVYYPFGQSLRLNIADLKAICDAYPNADQALEEVILLWLDKKYNVEKFGKPTWRMLVEAVDRKRGGNNHELAKKIATKHPSGSSSLLLLLLRLFPPPKKK